MSRDVHYLDVSQTPDGACEQTDIRVLRFFEHYYEWNTDLEMILSHKYQALVLTDKRQFIQWVSSGFEGMTGYTGDDVLGKTPGLLQGENTSEKIKENIKVSLNAKITFTETILNYRRDGTEYLCEITVFPILNRQHSLTHFLAIENEII